jgi:hypothetical protein
MVSGAVSVTNGAADHGLGVLAVGLGVLADVTGSATLVWRFRTEQRRLGQSQAAEARPAIVVAAALASVSRAGDGHPSGTSGVTLAAAAVSLAVLTPLAYAKRRLGAQMASRVLQGGAALSGIGAAPACWRSPPCCCTTPWDGGGPPAPLPLSWEPSQPPRHGIPQRTGSRPCDDHTQPPSESAQAAVWQAQPHDRPAHVRRPSMIAQPAILNATIPSSHHAPNSVLAASPAKTATAR